jgi:hypothetical protein
MGQYHKIRKDLPLLMSYHERVTAAAAKVRIASYEFIYRSRNQKSKAIEQVSLPHSRLEMSFKANDCR